MNENKIFRASAPSRTKRMVVGAASVLAAGALLGVGAQGATAAPLSATPGHTTSSSASASASPNATSGDAFLSSLKKELRADLAHGHDQGEKAQNVAKTIAGHSELFSSLPANLQADLTTLKDASADDRDAAMKTIETTALAGGYGEEFQKVATAVRENPKHPLGAVLHSLLGNNLGGDHGKGAESGPSVTKLALTLVDNPALFSKLPADLQTALTDLKNTPAAEQDAAAQVIETAALNGDYGQQIQQIAEKIQARTGTHATSSAGAGGDAGTDDAHVGGHAKAGTGH
jgi:hypothetical protein